MSTTICIRFLSGRAHLHPWDTHHSEGRVDWPPSPWRLLRAIVAVSGRGYTTLPSWGALPEAKPVPETVMTEMTSLSTRGIPKEKKGQLTFSKTTRYLRVKDEGISDEDCELWKQANQSHEFAAKLLELRRIVALPEPVAMPDSADDEIPLSHLARLLDSLKEPPEIWLPISSIGHTRQFFPVDRGVTGSAVFDTFAVVDKSHPIYFHWPDIDLSASDSRDTREHDLRKILKRMTYFGRAESWCEAAYSSDPLPFPSCAPLDRAHQTPQGVRYWPCFCWNEVNEAGRKMMGREHRDFTLMRKLAAIKDNFNSEVAQLLPEVLPRQSEQEKKRQKLRETLPSEDDPMLLLRCLLRETGEDMRDGLDRPIGTRWVHYAVPKAIFQLPPRRPTRPKRPQETVHVVRYALNTATTHRPVLPPLADTLLVAGKFRDASIAVFKKVLGKQSCPRNLCGHDPDNDGKPQRGHQHAFFWPTDEDNDGFIDHVTVYCAGGFEQDEVDALRRLVRIRQRGARPDLLITPVFVGEKDHFKPWQANPENSTRCFVSATPYFCPVHLSHGRSRGRTRPIQPQIIKGLTQQNLIGSEADVEIEELVFDYDPEQLVQLRRAIDAGDVSPPVPPRQYFPLIEPPADYPPLPRLNGTDDPRYAHAALKHPDEPFPFGLSIGLFVDHQTRFIRALSFNRRRRNAQVKGYGRMFRIRFRGTPPTRPFAIGDQCHFGLGLFTPIRDTNR